jgi:hypothetical protein
VGPLARSLTSRFEAIARADRSARLSSCRREQKALRPDTGSARHDALEAHRSRRTATSDAAAPLPRALSVTRNAASATATPPLG